jgi:2'-5' RNA ligase
VVGRATAASGFSIWLMPPGELHERLSGLIATLGRRLGTPVFEPHVTLLGGIEQPRETVLASAASLAEGLRPFEVRLGGADHRPEYFRCVFLTAEGDALRAAHARAKEAFGRRHELFEPHLSLVYGDLPAGRREALLTEIGAGFDSTFEVRALSVYSTAGEPAAWLRVGSLSLVGTGG